MAHIEKYTDKSIRMILAHCERHTKNPSNENISPDKSHLNYSLLSGRENVSSYEYYKKRKSELYVYNRSDVKVAFSVVVSAPRLLPPSQHDKFFQCVHDFLCARYGGLNNQNVIQSIVHLDETTPHLHFLCIPTVKDSKHGGEKICCCQVINRNELRKFHPDLQKYLREHGIFLNINSGITRMQGGNRTVKELKRVREYERNMERSFFE